MHSLRFQIRKAIERDDGYGVAGLVYGPLGYVGTYRIHSLPNLGYLITLRIDQTHNALAINYSFGLPLKNHFAEFVYYEGLFLPHEIDRILGFWDDDKTIKAEVSGEEVYKEELRKSSVMWIDDAPENKWIYQKLASIAVSANNERYWFDLLGFHEELQLARYSEGDFFDWHLDFGKGDISARKLSMTIQLSDPDEYEGGDLQFMVNQNIITAPRKKGTIIIFPSFIIHRVTPITKGTRQSIVGWVTGPPFR